MENSKASNSFSDQQTLLAAADGIALFLDTDLTVINCTPRAAKLLQIVATDYGQPLANFESVIGYPNLVSDAQQVLTSVTPVERETSIGLHQPYLLRIAPYTDSENTHGLVITLRQTVAEPLVDEASAPYLSSLVHQALAYIALHQGPEHEYVFTNARYNQIIGHREVIGKKMREVLPELEGQSVFERFDKVYKTGEIDVGLGLEVSFRRRENGPLEQGYFDQIVSPWRGADGRVQGVMSYAFEVTQTINIQQQLQDEIAEKEAAEKALQASQQTVLARLNEIDAIYDTAPVGLCVLDTEFRYVRINQRLAEINGPSVEEHLGKTVREIVPNLAGEAEVVLRKIIETGEPALNIEVRGETPAQPGVERVWLENWLPYKNQQGEVIGINIVAEEITEQRKMKLAVQESEKRYTQLFNALDDGFCVCELLVDENQQAYGYRFIEVNRNFELHSGLKDAEGKTTMELVPGLEQHWFDAFAKVTLQGETLRFEQVAEVLNRWFEIFAFPFGLQGENQFAVQFKDITERKQEEEAIQAAKEEAVQQRQQLYSIFEQAPVAIAILRGSDYIIDLANPTGSEVWGLALDEAIGKPLFEAIPGAEKQGFKQLLDNVVRTSKPFIGQELPITLNQPGRPATEYFNFVYHPWRNSHGQIDGVITVATNATGQVLARQAIEAKNRELEVINKNLNKAFQEQYKLTALLNNSSDFIGLATPEGVGVYINPAGLAMVGLAPTQPVSEVKIDDFFFENDLPFVQETILSTLIEEGKWAGEVTFRHFKTKEPIPVLYNTFTVNDPASGELLGLATITIDITERKQAEEALQQTSEELEVANEELMSTNEELLGYNEELSRANEQLKQVNADLDNFVYMASHDLKTPISNIEGLMNTLTRNLGAEKAQSDSLQRLLDMMQASINRFKSTLTELAQIAQLQREVVEDVTLVPLQKILDEVQLDLAMHIELSDARIDIDIANCPTVKFSAKNLRSVVYNLLSNAIKYRSPNRPIHVKVSCKEVTNYYILSVADNGLGMEVVDEQKVFGMFQRLHDHVEGTGVGLYITRKIIETVGGKIEVHSELEVGTTFTVYFPR